MRFFSPELADMHSFGLNRIAPLKWLTRPPSGKPSTEEKGVRALAYLLIESSKLQRRKILRSWHTHFNKCDTEKETALRLCFERGGVFEYESFIELA